LSFFFPLGKLFVYGGNLKHKLLPLNLFHFLGNGAGFSGAHTPILSSSISQSMRHPIFQMGGPGPWGWGG
jgi:hypothetical protein